MPPTKAKSGPEILAATRPKTNITEDVSQLGGRVRQLRKERNLTLEEAGRLTGLAASTLSKIENDQMSPTFDVVQKLAQGFAIDITQLFSRKSGQAAAGRRSITLAGAGRLMPAEGYAHRLLAAELTNKRILPFETTVTARSVSDIEWSNHDGEEFAYVLRGEICFMTEHYEPAILGVGDSVYIDSGMRHGCYTTSKEDAILLWINTGG